MKITLKLIVYDVDHLIKTLSALAPILEQRELNLQIELLTPPKTRKFENALGEPIARSRK